MTEYRLTEAGRIGLRMLLDAESLCRADRRGLHLLGMEDVVDLPDEWVEPVPPPLQPEPEPGVYLLRLANGGEVVARRPDEYSKWLIAGRPDWFTWEAACASYVEHVESVTRLVPAPEPVTLPWKDETGVIRVHVHDTGARREVIDAWGGGHTVLSPETARAKAHALLSAAGWAEAVDRG